jgi:AcrR family transcriptional regulator
MRTWDMSDPKAALMTRKRDAIVDAALTAFLRDGYEGSSVNRIAEEAGVSIKTLYRHFESKDDLFVAVIRAACAAAMDAPEPAWLGLAPLEGLAQAASEHLPFVLEPEQLALYRVVTHESAKFPQLGLRYREHIIGERVERLCRFFASWPEPLRSRIGDPTEVARAFIALAEADYVTGALLGATTPGVEELRAHAVRAARRMMVIINADLA